MVKKFFKKSSRRVSTRTRAKVERKVREHKRKLNKLKRREKHKNHFKITNKPKLTVPNEAPFKETVLNEAEEARRLRKEELKQIREAAKKNKIKKKKLKKGIEEDLSVNVEENPLLIDQLPIEEQLLIKEKLMTAKNIAELEEEIALQEVLNKADKNSVRYDEDEVIENEAVNGFAVNSLQQPYNNIMESSAKKFYSQFKKVVAASDVILQVLDARDPLGTRSDKVEQIIKNAGPDKKLILILNKTDLVPQENLRSWLLYLRKEYPTVAFQSMQIIYEQPKSRALKMRYRSLNQKPKIKEKTECLGGKRLMDVIKSYRKEKENSNLTVGVVGYPNVGKSSLINSLKKNDICDVSFISGHTQDIQVIQLGDRVQLIDCPGVIIKDSEQTMSEENVLRNALKPDILQNPTIAIRNLVEKVPKETLMLYYIIPEFTDAEDFLLKVAEKRKLMTKHSIYNKRKAALTVLKDWNNGNLKHCTLPPVETDEMLDAHPDELIHRMGDTALNRVQIVQLPPNHEQETVRRLASSESNMEVEELLDHDDDDDDDDDDECSDEEESDMGEDEEEEMESDQDQDTDR